MTKIRRIFAGIGALVALVVLLVGVPWLLSHFIGWPLPRRMPSLGNLGHDLSQRGIPDKSLVDALAVVVWIVWALLAVSVIAETIATVRGARASRVPVAGLFQPLTGKLVAAILVAVLALAPRNTSPRPATAGLTPASGRPVATAILTDVQLAANRVPLARSSLDGSENISSTVEVKTATPASTRTYVVHRGDTLWGIAKRELGDPLRWREIAALNEGRHETAGTFSDPHWIYPGWTLLLPDAGAGAPNATTTPPKVGTSTPTNDAGAHNTLPGVHPANSTKSSGVSAPTFPDVTHPAGPGALVAPSHVTPHGQDAASNEHRAPVPIAPIGVGLLGVAILGLLGGLRLAQQRHRRTGRRIALPTGSLAEVEQALAVGANRGAAMNIDRAIRLFGRLTRDTASAPTVLGAEVASGRVRFFLEDAMPAMAPFAADGPTWLLDLSDSAVCSALIDAADEPSLLPGLVTIGADEGGIVLLNLESGGTMSIGGDPVIASELATAVALELAGASWVERAELYDVGVGTGLANPDRCMTLSSLGDGLTLALAHVERTNRELDRSGRETAGIARLVGRDEDWSPFLFVSSEAPSEGEAELLAGIADPERSALVIVAPGEFSAGWRLVAYDDGSVEVPILRRRLHAQRVSRDHLAGIASVLGLAAEHGDVAPSEEPYASITIAPDAREFPIERNEGAPVTIYEDDDDEVGDVNEETLWIDDPDVDLTDAGPTDSDLGAEAENDEAAFEVSPASEYLHVVEASHENTVQVEVDVIGPLQIVGLVRPPSRGKVNELIAWLALHPEGGSADRVGTALWPSGKFSEHTLRNYRWDARRALGADAEGVNLLSEYDDLRVSGGVSTDWARFRALAADQSRERRHGALELVRGRPFGELEWTWLTLEGLVSAIEAEVADAALALGAEEIEHEEYDGALHAVEQGLKVMPYDERLHRFAMTAHHGAGNTSGVRLAMDRLVALVEEGVEPVDSISEETRSLYQSLVNRTRQHSLRAIH